MSEQAPVVKTVLSNGLTIQLKEIHTAPIISSWMWYRVGSRNESPGITGVSHWVEHMQFKGTPKFPPGILDKMISREGGFWNAMTYIDWTTYFETMPSDKIDIAYQLEADRMVSSSFDPKEVASERTVIISEREGNENEPLFLLGEAVQSTAYKRHPYHHEVIGDLKDLRSMTRDDLYQHYQQFYHPGNAIMTVAGDFESKRLLPYLTDLFGSIPSKPKPKIEIPLEPPQDGEKRVEVKGSGETTYIQVAYRAPNAIHDDFFPLLVLDTLLTGPSSLNILGGGGISNKTSRLYQQLVEKELVVGVHGSLQATIDPFMYDITLTLNPLRKLDEVLAALDKEIEKVLSGSVTQVEIERAIKQTKALFVYSAENITNQAFWMGYSEIFATYDWFLTYLDRISAVKPADILRIAQRYIQSSNRVVGVYLPSKSRGGKSK
jgi:zinc protease